MVFHDYHAVIPHCQGVACPVLVQSKQSPAFKITKYFFTSLPDKVSTMKQNYLVMNKSKTHKFKIEITAPEYLNKFLLNFPVKQLFTCYCFIAFYIDVNPTNYPANRCPGA